jgi:hypothetical protein
MKLCGFIQIASFEKMSTVDDLEETECLVI